MLVTRPKKEKFQQGRSGDQFVRDGKIFPRPKPRPAFSEALGSRPVKFKTKTRKNDVIIDLSKRLRH